MDFWTQIAKAPTSGQHELWSIYVVQRGGLGKRLEGRAYFGFLCKSNNFSSGVLQPGYLINVSTRGKSEDSFLSRTSSPSETTHHSYSQVSHLWLWLCLWMHLLVRAYLKSWHRHAQGSWNLFRERVNVVVYCSTRLKFCCLKPQTRICFFSNTIHWPPSCPSLSEETESLCWFSSVTLWSVTVEKKPPRACCRWVHGSEEPDSVLEFLVICSTL